ncbi:MAG: hypothetical protein IKA19_03025 [Muribaculaceae bacterium]|nr:hypothetical protein [Muribaculaceae bacterium]
MDKVKLIIIIFIAVITAIVRSSKKAKQAQEEQLRRKISTSPNNGEDFHDEFRFLYNDENNHQNPPQNTSKPSPGTKVAEEGVRVTTDVPDNGYDIYQESNEDDNTEYWRQAIINAEILKTKF